MAEKPIVSDGNSRPRPSATQSASTINPRSLFQATGTPNYSLVSTSGIPLATDPDNSAVKDAVERIAIDISLAGLLPGTTSISQGPVDYHTSGRRFLVPDILDNNRFFKFEL